jgi:hypothetical protein
MSEKTLGAISFPCLKYVEEIDASGNREHTLNEQKFEDAFRESLDNNHDKVTAYPI